MIDIQPELDGVNEGVISSIDVYVRPKNIYSRLLYIPQLWKIIRMGQRSHAVKLELNHTRYPRAVSVVWQV